MIEPSVFPQYAPQRTQYDPKTNQYDPRTVVTSGPLVAPHMAPHYVTAPAYGVSPVSNMEPHFPVQAHYIYGQYDQPAGHLAMPYSRMSPQQERLGLPMLPQIPQQPIQGHQRQQRSLSAAGSAPKTPDPMNTKEITYTKPVMTDDVVFTTPIDVMMKALQKRKDKEDLASSNSSEAGACSVKSEPFSPHPKCEWHGCGRRFSQPGNLKTHTRLHTGERPFECEMCGACFAQRGNLTAHKETHSKTKPFVCKLDNCNKCFTTRGNLKNKYHKDTIGRLVDWIISLTDVDALSPKDRDLLWYFSNIYKNSNKGIKGRGRDRRVSEVRMGKTKLSSPGMGLPRSKMLDSSFSRMGLGF
ncbi:zinc finger protein [Verticillium dahliae]